MIKNNIFRQLAFLMLFLNAGFAFGQSGVIEGRVIDKETQEPLFGASIILEGTTVGAMVDMDGNYVITNVRPGNYNLLGSYISYETKTVENIAIQSGEKVRIDIELESQYNTLEAVGIVTKANRETETALLLDRRNAISATQSIGASELSRKGISDAQAAVSSVSGISKQEGVKNIFVRGLGDRYNSTLLNGLPIPSEDPEYKNISLSIFESDIIKNIGVEKVFTSSYSGDVGGAIIDISSKELVGRRALDFSISGGFNSNTIGETFYKPDGADYFGFSNSQRPTNGLFNFPNRLDPSSPSMLLNHSFRVSGGKRFYINDNPLTFYVVASHSVENMFTEEVVRNMTSNGTIYQDQIGKKYGNKTNQLALANIHYDINNKHSLAYNFMMLHSTNQYVGDYLGKHSERFQDSYNESGFNRRQQINDNLLFTHQLLSNWQLHEKLDLSADFSLNTISGLEPDRRENYLSEKENGTYGLTGSNRQKRFFSELTEHDYNTKFVLSYSLNDALESNNSKILLGYHGQFATNDFESIEYNFSHIPGDVPLTNFSLDQLYNEENYSNESFSMTESNPNKYSVEKNNHSVFAQGNYQFTKAFSANLGFRMDFVNLHVEYDVPGQMGANSIVNPYYLPSLNLKYDINDNNSLRLGASKTYTLPQSKEISPFQYVNISFASEGNPNLLPSDNYNIDFRWDNYLSASELLSGTVFYKRIENPIGRVDKGNSAGLLTYENISDVADVMGVEIEVRKNLLTTENLENQKRNKLSLGTNASYILTTTKLNLTNTPERTSELEGASPFLLNADLTHQYTNKGNDWTTSLVFNYFSDRIHTIGTIGYEDIMEEGTATLNLISSYKFSNNMGISLKVSNLLDSPIELTRKISSSNEKITLNKFNRGINFSLGFSFEI